MPILSVNSQTIKYYSPKKIKPSDSFVITGKGFGNKRCSKCAVYFGNKKVFSYTNWSNLKITGKAPVTITRGKKYELIIQTKDKKIKTKKFFTVLRRKGPDKNLKIKYFSPKVLKPNSNFTIIGQGFGSKRYDGCYVYFGTNKIFTYTQWNDEKITGKSPKYISPGIHPLIIKRGKKSFSTGETIRVLGISNIQQIPDIRSQLLFGTANFINIYGVGFGKNQSNGYVLIKDTKILKVVSWSDTLVKIPLNDQIKPGKYPIYIINAKGLRSKYRKSLYIRGIKTIKPSVDTIGGVVSVLGYGFGYNTKSILKLGKYTIQKFKKWKNNEVSFTIPSNVLPGSYKIKMSILVSAYSKKYVDFISNDSLTLLYRVKTVTGKIFGSFYTLSLRPAIFNTDENLVKFIYSTPNDCQLSMRLYNSEGILISTLITKEKKRKKGRYFINIEKKYLPSGKYKILMDINEKIKIIRSFNVIKKLR